MSTNYYEDGVLSDTQIAQMKDSLGTILSNSSNIQPAGVDISSEFEEIYEMKTFSLPSPHEKVGDLAMKFCNEGKARKIKSSVLEPGKIYLAKLAHSITEMPHYCKMDTKSTIGRLFSHTRLMADCCNQYDVIPVGYSGSLWLQMRPKTFYISTEDMIPLTQLRLFKGDARLTSREIQLLMSSNALFFKKQSRTPLFSDEETYDVHGGSVGSLMLSTDFQSDIVAYRTKECKEPITLSAKGLDYKKYFDVITKEDCRSGIDLMQGVGYLFGTTEVCAIPSNLAAEVVAFDERFGEARGHFAGFIDPGFGNPEDHPITGNSITLEIMAYESGITLRDQQAIGMLCFEKMSQIPSRLYKGNYAIQKSGPKLPRQFVMP